MSAKLRKIPKSGTVTSVPIDKNLWAYISSRNTDGTYWLYYFLTTERVCDRSLFSPARWKKFFDFKPNGVPVSYIDGLKIKLTPDEMKVSVTPRFEEISRFILAIGGQLWPI